MSDIPSDMTITMHLCRGNYQSTFMASGGYDAGGRGAVQPIKVHGYFMEYDTERAGGFEPLRLVPKDKPVVLGLVTTKTGELEIKDELKRRIDEARNIVASISSASRRNAALPRPRKATSLTEERAMGEAAHDRGGGGGGLGIK